MDKIEKWIRQDLSAAVAGGNGFWSNSSIFGSGNSIYTFSNDHIEFTLATFGLQYTECNSTIFVRYDEIENIVFPSLQEIMIARGNANTMFTICITFHSNGALYEIRLPLCVYSPVTPLLSRIVNELR